MNNKVDKKYNPEPDYPYFLYDPEGNGFEYFKTEKLRDDCASDAVQAYLDEAWDEQVTNVVVGKISGQATMTDVKVKPDIVDEDGNDENDEYWDSDWDYKCDYAIKPVGFICPSTKALKPE
jgi:hypothetical protein